MTAILNRIIHSSFRAAGIVEDDDKRALYQRVTGKTGLTVMSDREKDAVADELRRLGATSSGGSAKAKGLQGKFAKKLQALWIAAWNLGLVRDRRDSALIAFVHRQTGLDHVRFLHHADDAKKAIEALKDWMRREARVGYGNTNGQEWLSLDGAKVAWAQWRILNPGADLIVRKGFDAEAIRLAGRSGDAQWLADLKDADWRRVMNTLGERVRAAKKGGTA